MSTRSDGPTRREDVVIRVLALGAAGLLLGGGVSSWQELPAGSVPPPSSAVAQVESMPSYVVAPAVVVDAAPTSHPATGRPVWLRVPDLDVSVPVVGIDLSGGTLVPPSDPQQLGWWQDGAAPGDLRGTAVVTGHTVSTGGGALDELDALARGDRVVVRTVAGTIAYEVTEVVRYSKTTLAEVSREVFAQEAPGRLVLVTCTDFDGHDYLGNTLVFASPRA